MPINIKNKLAGILVPVFALRHEADLGIGDTHAMKEAVDFCQLNKIGVLQILPINETGGDNSPYNAISSQALEPAYITISPMVVPGLSEGDISASVPSAELHQLRAGSVNYPVVKKLKLELLSRAFDRFEEQEVKKQSALAGELASFENENRDWLEAYTLFRALIDKHGGNTAWPTWPEEVKSYEKAGAAPSVKSDDRLARQRRFFSYVQWVAYRQWVDLKSYAEQNSVEIMGDLPFGVSRYSADVWSQQQLFDLTWSCGAPPEKFFAADRFTKEWGQNWGMPLYDWKAHEKENFRWWRQRVGGLTKLFHSFRIDHVLGFFRVYAFPWIPERNHEFADLTKEEAEELTGGSLPQFLPRSDDEKDDAELNEKDGEKILKVLIEAAGDAAIVAEDLGVVPDYVRPLLHKLGIAGFAIPIFERVEEDRSFKPKESLPELSLATYGTHDHQPLRTFYEGLVTWWLGPDGHDGWLEVQRLMTFLGWDEEREPPREFTHELHLIFIRVLLETPCWLSVLMITDLLGTAQRFNEPGLSGEYNWSQRLEKNILAYQTDERHASTILAFAAMIGESERAPKVLSSSKKARH